MKPFRLPFVALLLVAGIGCSTSADNLTRGTAATTLEAIETTPAQEDPPASAPAETAPAETAATETTPAETTPECSGTVARDVVYRTLDGVDPSLLAVDVYPVEGRCDAPVAVWVHGGGWSVGDKGNGAAQRAAFYNSQGWMLVAVNYRLSTRDADPPVQFPDHNNDVAAAIAWVMANAAEYGGDPSTMLLVGHSAGAGIVASVVADPSLLDAHELTPADIDCVVLLDTAAYDIAAAAQGANSGIYRNAFGDDPDVWEQASPGAHVGEGPLPGRVLVVTQGGAARVATARAFADLLVEAGVDTELFDASPLNHGQVNNLIGSDDDVMTPLLIDELANCNE